MADLGGNNIGSLVATLGVDTSSLMGSRKSMTGFAASAEKNMGKATKSTSKLTKAFKTLGGVMTIALTVRKITQFGTEGVRVFGELGDSVAKASTLFGEVIVDTNNLTTQIRKLSNESGLAATTIGASLYQALSAGVDVTSQMGVSMVFLKSSSKLARAGFTDMSTAVEATIKTINAYGLEMDQVERIQKILMQTQNKGITTVGELGGYLAQVTPVAAQFGVTFENVGASMSTLTSQGVRTRIAVTQLSALFLELGKAGTEGAKALDVAARNAGFTTGNFAELMKSGMSLGEVLNILSDEAKASGKTLMDVFSSAEAGKAAVAMTGKMADRMASNFQSMSTEADLLQEGYDKVMKTMAVKTEILGTKIQNLKGLVGEVLSPSVILITGYMDDWVTANSKLLAQNLTKYANNFTTAIKFAAKHMDKLVFLVKGLIGYKIGVWLATATTGMTLFADATYVAIAAARTLGKVLLIGFAIEGITRVIDEFNRLNKLVKETPLVWKTAAAVSMDFFVNSIINTFAIIGTMMMDLVKIITEPIVYGLAAIFSKESLLKILEGDTEGAFDVIGKAMGEAVTRALVRIPKDFETLLTIRNVHIATDDQINEYRESMLPKKEKPWEEFTPMSLPDDFWSIGDSNEPIVPPEGAGFGDLESVAKSHMASLETAYKGFQDELTLMDYDGWEKRREEVKLWGANMQTELETAGVWNDDFKTLITSMMDTQNLLIEADKKVADTEAYTKRRVAVKELANNMINIKEQIKAMAAGPDAFAAFIDAADTAAQIEEITATMVALGASPEWIKINIPYYEKWINLLKEGKKEMTELEKINQTITDISNQAFDTMFKSLIDNLLDGENAFKSFGNVAMQILSDIAYKALTMSVINPLSDAMGGFLSGLFSSNAKGNIYNDKGLMPFAHGGIVDKPTIFPFANGTGLMGEAGPEGIMPLTRVGGDLGVNASGMGTGSSDVVVNIINKGGVVEKESQTQKKGPKGENIIEIVVKSALDRLDSKGSLDNMFQKHGARRAGSR